MHIGAGCCFHRRVMRVAQGYLGLALLAGVRLDPAQPLRPPAAVVLLGVVVPGARVAAELAALEVVGFGVARRVENALDVPAIGQNEALAATDQQARAIDRVPGGDVIVDPGDVEAVDRDLLQVDRGAADFQAAGTDQRVVFEEVDQVAMQGGRQAGVVVVPVENVEGRRLLAEQVVVDPVVPDQVVGAHPGEHPGHVAAVQYALLVGPALGRFQGFFVGEEHGRAVELAVKQADQVGGAGDFAQLPLGLQVPLQGGDGQAAGAGTQQVDVLAGGDRPTDIDGFLDRLHIARQAPLAVRLGRVTPAHHEYLQAVFQCVLDEALVRRQVEDVVLVDLWRHDQQRAQGLLLAHWLVLDQLQQFIAKLHRAGCGGQAAADFEGSLVDLAGQTIVVQQVVEQVAQAFEYAAAASVEQFLERQWVEQGIGGGQGIAEDADDEARASAVVGTHVAFLDPVAQLILPGQVGLQAAPVKRIEFPGRIGKARILRVDLVRRVAEQYSTQLPAQGQYVSGAVNRLAQALHGQAAQGGKHVSGTQASNGALGIHRAGRGRKAACRGLFAYEATLQNYP